MYIGLREAEASQRIASFGPSAEMAWALWDRDFAADCAHPEAGVLQRVEPQEAEAPQLFRLFSRGHSRKCQ